MLEKQRNSVLKDELEKRRDNKKASNKKLPTLRIASSLKSSFLQQTPRSTLSKNASNPVFKSRAKIKEEFEKRGVTIEEFRDPLVSTLDEVNFEA